MAADSGNRDRVARRFLRAVLGGKERRIGRAGELGSPLEARAVDRRPVLLVHGFGNRPASMLALARSLERDGFDATAIELPEFGTGDAMRDARLVVAAAADIRTRTGAPRVDLVGHSRGGLVARAAAQLVDDDSTIGRVVTINSGNQGVHLGRFAWLVRLLSPSGAAQATMLTELSDELRATAGQHDLHAVGTDGIDGWVIPATVSRIEGAPWYPVDEGRTIGPLSRVGHYSILRDDRTYEVIRDVLLAGR